ncbi:MAG: flagellar motor protein MotB [Defluviitaleaceae bacterium]|nr:flagellar motor protein MotB [Defluviitaleaceae bacterium]
MNKNKPKDDPNKVLPGWMASYADMFTVLMAFFVLLFAMSQIDEDLFERFIVSFNPARAEDFSPMHGRQGDVFAQMGEGIMPEVVPPPEPGATGDEEGQGEADPEGAGGREHEGDAVGDMMNTFRTYMAENLPSDDQDRQFEIDVTEGENYIRIDIGEHDGVFFNSGQARLTPSGINVLNYLGPMLANFASTGHGIIIEGHTDDRPINTAAFPSNITLSGARASSAVEHLTTHFDIPFNMIAGIGRGEHFPVATNETEAGRAANRRVEIKVFTSQTTEGGPVSGWFQIPGTR